MDGDPGALATPRNRGQRSWVQIPPAPPILEPWDHATYMERDGIGPGQIHALSGCWRDLLEESHK